MEKYFDYSPVRESFILRKKQIRCKKERMSDDNVVWNRQFSNSTVIERLDNK